jgi:hypothetical protein
MLTLLTSGFSLEFATAWDLQPVGDMLLLNCLPAVIVGAMFWATVWTSPLSDH